MEPYKKSFVPFDSIKSNLNNIDNPVKNKASSSYNGGKAKEKVLAP